MKHLLAALTAVLSLVAVGCSTTPGDDPNAIHIAVALPLSGKFASNGEPHRAAIQMAFSDIEAAGGVRGRPIRADVIDCGGDGKTATERLKATLGPWDAPTVRVRAFISSTTACNEATTAYALQQKVPHIEVSSGSDDDEVLASHAEKDTLDRSFDFQVRALCTAEATMTPRFIAERMNSSMQPEMTKVAILRGSHPHDISHTLTVRGQFAALNRTDLLVNPGADESADITMPTDGPYNDAINKAIAAGADTIYFHLNGDLPNLKFFEELKRLGFAGKIVTCGMVAKPIVLDQVTPRLIDYLGGRLYFMMRGPAGSAELTSFQNNFLAFYGSKADTFAASAYDGAMLVALGLVAETEPTGTGLRDAILKVASGGTTVKYGETAQAIQLLVGGTDINYDGASGTLNFRDDHTVPSKYFVNEVRYDAAMDKGSYNPLSNPVIIETQ